MKKLYLVKREVIASNIKQAMFAKGKIYEISEADENSQPVLKKDIGFKNKKK